MILRKLTGKRVPLEVQEKRRRERNARHAAKQRARTRKNPKPRRPRIPQLWFGVLSAGAKAANLHRQVRDHKFDQPVPHEC